MSLSHNNVGYDAFGFLQTNSRYRVGREVK
jgi:hypothetical protein